MVGKYAVSPQDLIYMLVPVYDPPPSQTADAVYGTRLKNVLSAGVTILIRVNVVTHHFR